MHEMSVAQSLIEIIHQHVSPRELDAVRVVRLKVGALSGVVPDSLEFSFSALTAGTPLARSRMEIQHIPYQLRCSSCGSVSEAELGLSVCPVCSGVSTETVSGTELHITEIELADESGTSP